MAATTDRPLETAGVFEDKGGATPLLGFANMMGLKLPPAPSTRARSEDALQARTDAGERVAQSYEGAAKESEQTAAELKRVADTQEAERRAAKPTSPAIDPPPSQASRAFLQPGDSLLGQLQTAMVGIGNMVLQAKGMSGSAIAATAAIKGLAQGWAEGDAERIKHEYTTWKANSDRLLTQHKLARESWEDLLTDHKQSWDSILAQTRVRAEINGNKALAEAARVGNIDAVLKSLQQAEQNELAHERFRAEMEHWHAQAAEHEKNFLATEAHRRETEARARETSQRGERRLKLSEDTNAQVMKLQGQDLSMTQRIETVGIVKDAVELLAREGILGTGTSFLDKAQVQWNLQSKPGRTDILNAVNILQRLGTPLVVGAEMSLGMQASTMRLKVVGEAEAGNILGAPKDFWDLFLPRVEKYSTQQRDLARSHLKDIRSLNPYAPPAEESAPASSEYQVVR